MSEVKNRIVEMLQGLLLDEYLQRDVYEAYQYSLFGVAVPGIQEHLKAHMEEEMGHIIILQRYLMELGGEVLLERHPVPPIEASMDAILKKDLELEYQAVTHYAQTIGFLDGLECAEGDELCDKLRFTALRVDLENILVEEQEHVHDLIQWLNQPGKATRRNPYSMYRP